MLFRPKELQKYEFYGKDKTQIYWLHFTGSDVKNTLRDVYKRQAQRHVRWMWMCVRHRITPSAYAAVSYTHLDVYKRQASV